MRHYSHTIHIAAPAAAVWEVIVDLEGWSRWNMLEARAPRGLAVGNPLKLGIAIGGARLPARATVVAVDENERLRWRGGIPGVFHADHGFTITASNDGCRVTHDEIFHGALVGVALRALGPDPESRYRIVNERLARIAGSGPSSPRTKA